MSEKNKLKSELILEVAQLQKRIKELESAAYPQSGNGPGSTWDEVLSSSPDHILALALDLTILYVNHRAPGLTNEELIGAQITSFLPEDRQPEVKAILLGVIESGQATIYETEYFTPEGEVIYFETHAIPRKSAGKMIGLLLNSRDCSKRKRIELKLQESEEKYRALYEYAPLPYQSLDEEGRFLDVNPAWLRTLGYKRDQVIGENFADFLRPDSKPHFEINFPAFKERGYVSDVRFKIRHKDGHHLDISFEGCIGYNLDGEFLQTYCVFQDITERLRSLEEVSLQENRIQSIFRSAPIGIGLVINRTMQEVNEELCKMVGYSIDELINQNSRMLYPTQADFDFVGKEKYSQISKSGTGSVETRFLRKNGEVIDVIVSSTPVDVKDQGKGVTFTVLDISERKKAELALQANENLLNATQKLAKAGGWKWNVESKSMFWTDETYRIHGIDPNDLESGSMLHIEQGVKCYDEKDQQTILGVFQKCVEEGIPYDLEFPFTTFKGKKRWIRTIARAERENDKIVNVIGNIVDITDRKIAEKQYKDLVEKAEIAILIIDLDGNFAFFNSYIVDLFGYPEEEIKSKNIRDLVHPGDLDFVLNQTQHRLHNQQDRHRYSFRGLRKDGTIIHVEIDDVAIEENNTVVGTRSYLRDITERILGIENLKKEKEFSERIINTSSALVLGLNNNHQIKIFNNGAENITGYKSKDVLGKDWFEIFFPDVIRDEMDQVWESAWGRKAHSYINPIQISDGSERIISWQTTGLYEEDNVKDQLMISIGEDITKRKQAERALSHSHELMTYIIEHNRSSIAVHDTDLKYIYVSRRYLEEYDVKDPNIIGKHHYDVFPDLPQKWRDVHQMALAGEISSGDNDPYYRDDGSVDWTRWECRPWYVEEGIIGGIIVYTEVITDQVQAAQEKDSLLKQVQEANERLKSLSRELIYSQEEERKRISRELHDELGQALTAISLDLGNIERELPAGCPADIKKRLGDTRGMADELDQMIGELALDLRPSLLDDLGLLPTLNWYVERFSQRAEIKVNIEDVGSEKRLPSEIETALYRIVQEALTNVAKHAKAEEVILSLNQQSKTMTMSIEDDGKGFDLAEMQSAHVPFHGLGLIGMGDRTALLGGHLDIQSSPGEGTRIEVKIPLD